MTLTKTSFTGAFWLGLLKVVIKAFSFLKIVIVARILSPTDLGLFGIVLLPYGLVEVMTESGINQALVQTQKDVRSYLSSAWVAFFFRGILIGGLLYLSAPLISRFYGRDLNLAIRLISLTPVLKGLANPAVVLFLKNLNFKKEFAYQSLASIVESLATIIFVLVLRNMLALPLGVVVGGLAALVFSFVFAPLQLIKVSFNKIKELYHYGKWVTIGTFMSFINDQGDDFFVSKFLGAYPLGLYQTAYKISNLPTTQGAGLIYSIIFPIFSSIQTDKVRLRRGLLKSLAITFVLSLTFAAGVYLFAPFFVRLFLGEIWLAMIPALNVLLLFGITRPLISAGSAVFDAVGQPKTVASINLIRLSLMVILLYPLTKLWGIVGTSWAVVIAQISVYPWFVIKLKKALSVTTNLRAS
ncbi:MAG: lipopolysaccharide biosynthesis protein [Candidatus Beckwithbacteria bacterium]|nr:lipopolysaccharide biosynthesis protein [Candidatus Beckwithbacteria bacterium]